MDYNAKNYTEQGGEKTVIGGTLEFTDDAVVKNFPLRGAVVEDSTATTVAGVVKDLNALIASLRGAGLFAIKDVSSIAIDEIIQLSLDSVYNMTAKIEPADATYPYVVWESSDEDIVVAVPTDPNGESLTAAITPKAVGIAYITVRAKYDESVSAKCKVIVVESRD